MATHHAVPNEAVDLETWTSDMPVERSKAIIKTDEAEIARLVLAAGDTIKTHRVAGPIIIHCILGSVTLTAIGKSTELKSNQLLYLERNEPHSLDAKTDAVLLLTIIFNREDA